MKKIIATSFMILLSMGTLMALSVEWNASYDSFRGIPDGSWNGNNGLFVSANVGDALSPCIDYQVGGSFGLYNWDGRENLVFENPKALLQEGFFTAGLSSCFRRVHVGLVYDHLYVNHFGIFNVNTSIDQFRFQVSTPFCCDEIGVWGTSHVRTSTENALGIPVSLRAIDQINLFWTHFFANCAKTTLWLGAPYRKSLLFPGQRAGVFIGGLSLSAPLTECLYFEGRAVYMRARELPGSLQSLNYASNVCVGLTYVFRCNHSRCNTTYQPLANNGNFLVDTDINQLGPL